MIIQAELKCKQTGCEADPCAVDKVIELPSSRFQQFSRALLADYDFIAENKNAIRHDEDARHCLLILDAEGTDGFLIDPQGYNYARYSAFVPNARSLLTPDMAIDRSYISPAEPWRDESRDEMLRMTLRVNGKPDYTLVLPADEEYLDAVKNYLDISGRSSSLASQSSSRRKTSIRWRRTVSCGSPSPGPSPSLKVNPSPPMSHGASAVLWRPERSASNIKSCTDTARVRMVSRRSFRNRRKSSDGSMSAISLGPACG